MPVERRAIYANAKEPCPFSIAEDKESSTGSCRLRGQGDGQSKAVSAMQPASGAHTQRHSLSPCPPPALRHPYVAILPSRRVPGRRSHAVLLCVPAPRIASVRRNPPFPRPVLANHFASAGVSNWGDRREIDIYIYIYIYIPPLEG